MANATEDLASIDGLLAEPASPVKPKPKPAAPTPAKSPAPAPATQVDEFGGLEEPASMRVALIPTVPARRPALDGLPDPEQDAEVAAARDVCARLADDLRAVVAERSELETELGVPLGASPRTLETLAVNMLAVGGSDVEVEKLKSLAGRETRLIAACKLASQRVTDLLTESRRKLTADAHVRLHKPAARRVAKAALNLLAKLHALTAANDVIQGAGFARPDGLFAEMDATIAGQNGTVSNLVRLGLLDRDEVAAALPLLAGY